MNLKLKIILFISILVLVSLGSLIFYLSYYKYQPQLKNEIIQRIDYQLNNITPNIYSLFYSKTKILKTDIYTFNILDKNKEICYIKILKGNKNRRLRYFDIIYKNLIILEEKKRIIVKTNYNLLEKVRNKRVRTKINLFKIATSKTNTITDTLTLYKRKNLKKVLLEIEKKVQSYTNKITKLINTYKKRRKNLRRHKKIYEPKPDYRTKYLVKSLYKYLDNHLSSLHPILVKFKTEKKIEELQRNIDTILYEDYKKINKIINPKKRIRKRLYDKYKWYIIKLMSIQHILKGKILSRLHFVNNTLLKNTEFYETGFDFFKKIKEENILKQIPIIKFYKPIIQFNEIQGIYEIGISKDEIVKKINPIITDGILSSSVFILVSILAGLVLSLYLIFPIRTLEKGADEILKDLTYRIKMKRKDEFGKFANTFNHLSNQLIEELSKYEKLYKEATEDELTKLMVRRYFLETLQRELENAKRDGRPTSIFMTDIDHFKKFNDTYGHQTGDIVLAKVASVILKSIRKNRVRNDIAGRYGGEEFIVLLPDTEKEEALAVAERIREKIEAMELTSAKGEKLKVTISIGVATSENSDISMEKLIEKADGALYKSKETGRNRVTYAE